MADVWVCLVCERGVANTEVGLDEHNRVMHRDGPATATMQVDGEEETVLSIAVKPLPLTRKIADANEPRGSEDG